MWLMWLATNTTGPSSSSRCARPATRRRVYTSISGASTPQTMSSRRRLAAQLRVHARSSSAGVAIRVTTPPFRDRFSRAARSTVGDDLARVQVRPRVRALEEGPQHRHPGRRDVLLEPFGMLGPHRVVVRECRPRVDERLLDRPLDDAVVGERVVIAG